MRGGSFDSPTADTPSHLGALPADQIVVCLRPSDGDTDIVSAWRRESAGALGCRPSSHRRTLSVAYLRSLTDVTDDQQADSSATRSMPNVRWICDAVAAAQCVCDVTGARTSSADDCRDEPRSLVDPNARTTAVRRIAAASRRSIDRPQRVSRSDPDMLNLPPSSSTSNCHEHSRVSRPSSLDRFRPQRQQSLPRSRDTPVAGKCDLSNH